MARRAVFTLAFVFVFCLPDLFAQNFSAKIIETIPISPAQNKLAENEQLIYSVEWLGIPVGEVVLTIQGKLEINAKLCYHLHAEALPNRFFRSLYDIEYKVDSYVEQGNFLPVRFEKVRKINKERSFMLVEFNQALLKAQTFTEGTSLNLGTPKDRAKLAALIAVTSEIKPSIQDLLSVLYYFRLLELEPDKSYSVNIYYDQRNWQMNIKIGKPFWREIRKHGSYPAVEVSTETALNNYILGQKNFSAVLTTGTSRIPLEFTLRTALGPVKARLKNIPKLK